MSTATSASAAGVRVPPGVLTRSRARFWRVGDARSLRARRRRPSGRPGRPRRPVADPTVPARTAARCSGRPRARPPRPRPGRRRPSPSRWRRRCTSRNGRATEPHPTSRPHDRAAGPAEAVGVDRRRRAEAHGRRAPRRRRRARRRPGRPCPTKPWAASAAAGRPSAVEPVGVALLGGDGDGDQVDVVGQVLGVLDHGRHMGAPRCERRDGCQAGSTERVGSDVPSCQRARVQSRSESRFR